MSRPVSKLPYEGIRRQGPSDPQIPAVIFGAGNKLRAGGPFLALFREFGDRLAASKGLLVVGYSFRDEHVNAAVTQWINTDPTRRLVILEAYAARFGDVPPTLDLSLRNYLWWMASDQPQRVKFVEAPTGTGLREAVQITMDGW